jgi:membrane glycosyltransferase
MLVLDADSRMGCESVAVLTEMLAADDGLGLVQSVPTVLPGRSVWQRMQSFASRAHGTSLGRGLALVSGGEGNFYGHNAIVRIRAFAASAGLPHIDAPPPFGGVIMSHDFVEAALLRRAGWRVAFAPEAEDSFEDTPETLSGFIRRDSRWCHGNMQHLLLLRARGLHLFSRFHFLHGAMNYLNAPLWFAAVLLWSFAPPEISGTTAWVLTACVASVLLVPRAIGLARVLSQSAGQRMMVLRDAMTELVLSSLIAPTLMVHRILMLMRLFLGAPATWPPHQMEAQPHLMLLWLHLPAVLTGMVLIASVLAGYASLWALPFAISLMFAPLLAMFVEMPARRQSSVTV